MISDLKDRTYKALKQKSQKELIEYFMKLLTYAKKSGIVVIPDSRDPK